MSTAENRDPEEEAQERRFVPEDAQLTPGSRGEPSWTAATLAHVADRIEALNQEREARVERLVADLVAGQEPTHGQLDEVAGIEGRLSALVSLQIRLEGGVP